MISYVDTSAAMKLVIQERESDALTRYLASPARGGSPRRLVASWLLHTELHCAAGRHPRQVGLDLVQAVLDMVALVDVTRGDFLTAGTLPGRLRSHDALHLTVALRAGAGEVITYDDELATAATAAGLVVARPA